MLGRAQAALLASWPGWWLAAQSARWPGSQPHLSLGSLELAGAVNLHCKHWHQETSEDAPLLASSPGATIVNRR